MDPWTSFVELLQAALFALAQVYGGNMGLAIITLSLSVRIALFPLTLKLARRGLVHQIALKKLQPELEAVKAKYQDQPEEMARETMKVFERHGVHPVDVQSLVGGLLQIPVFIALYSAIEKGVGRGGKFLWIANIANPDFWLSIVVAVFTFVSVTLTPSVSGDRRFLMTLLPALVTLFVLSRLAAGVCLYWAASNIVGIVQSAILRRQAKELLEA
jgi:YidC/Oxa1 family membrane protein insertase